MSRHPHLRARSFHWLTSVLARHLQVFLGLTASGVFFLGPDCLQAQQRIVTDSNSDKWETLEHCRLLENKSRDGDSFHVQQGNREYIFRLYFVDAPETDADFPERLDDQAAYFRLSKAQVKDLAREAREFTAGQLNAGFRVITRWENAGGRGNLARYYGIVMMADKNLSVELVRNGLARVHGKAAAWPEGPGSSQFISELKRLELDARERRLGVWDETRYPRPSATGETAVSSPVLIDLNNASISQLTELPGVGRTIARRIVSRRPYRDVNDLLQVKGIGTKSLERLRPLVTVGSGPVQN